MTEKINKIVVFDNEDIEYMAEKRINRSKFCRQAVKAAKEGKWEYDHNADN